MTQLSLPGDRRLQQAVDWGKQNVLDLTRYSEDLQVRWLDQGNQYTAPLGTVESARWVGAGFPDYPWMFATDGEYTAFASVAMGQFEAIKDHLVGLRDVSEILNEGSGIVTHEVISEGSNWFGHDSFRIDPVTGERRYNFNTDETVKYPSAVALIWRWTGDDRFRHELYDFSVRGMRAVVDRLDEDGDGWPEGSGNVERGGMGVEKLDNSVYLIRGLYDLADMARAEGDGETATVGGRSRAQPASAVRERVVASAAAARRAAVRRLDRRPAGRRRQQQAAGQALDRRDSDGGGADASAGWRCPAWPPCDHGDQALALRETDCYSGQRPYNLGLFHTGCGGGPDGTGERTIFGLNTAIQAVGEGNYGRLGAGQQQRYTDAEAEPMFGQPYTRRHAGRAARLAAGDPAVAGLRPRRRARRQHRALLELPGDVRPGLGPLRHGVAGRAPAARRAAGHGARRAGGRPAAAVELADRRPRHPRSARGRSTSPLRVPAAATAPRSTQMWTCGRSASATRWRATPACAR